MVTECPGQCRVVFVRRDTRLWKRNQKDPHEKRPSGKVVPAEALVVICGSPSTVARYR